MQAPDLDAVVLLEQQVYPHPWTRGNFADALAAGYHAQCLHQDGDLCAYVVAMAGAQEAHLLNVAHRYQQATDWHTRKPEGQ